MFRWWACLLLVVGLSLSSWAEYCPDCGMILMNKFQSKFERGATWQLHTCMNHHSYWLQAPGTVAQPDYRYRPPAPGRSFAYSFLPTPPRGDAVAVRLGVPSHQGPQRTFTS
ncbi:hypothetical protein IV102_17595 [bacterium]|nr:hypothetical protein [bacterium]